MNTEEIEIPFGARDSELKGWEYTIPKGMEAIIKDGKIIVREQKSEDERIRKNLIELLLDTPAQDIINHHLELSKVLAYLERRKEQKSAKWNNADDKIQRNLMSLLSCMRGDRIAEDTYKKYYPWLRDLPKRFNLQQSAGWSEEDEKMLLGIIERGSSQIPSHEPALRGEQMEWLMNRLKSLRPQPHKEIYQAAKHDLAIRFMNYLDENRPNGKMSLSNGECEDIDKAFIENDWAKILRYMEKYSPSWKPSEEQMRVFLKANPVNLMPEELSVYNSLCNDIQKLM